MNLVRLYIALLSTLFIGVSLADPIISEFVARNTSGIKDEDGVRSDWIEIYNPDASAVNLNGWYLTDEKTNLVKWQFPSTPLAAGARIVVYASGKDRSTAGSELHTNFSLSSTGEYLALVKPNGTDKSTEFDPYPVQKKDVSFGNSGVNLERVSDQSVLSYRLTLPPNDAQGDVWNEHDYDEVGWTTPADPGPIGYDNNNEYPIEVNVPAGTENVWIRYPFDITDTSLISELLFSLRYEDGFRAYLNGVEIAGENNTAPIVAGESNGFVSFNVNAFVSSLRNGDNVLAVHLINASAASSDLLFIPRLSTNQTSSSYSYSSTPTPGAANVGQQFTGFVADTKFQFGRGFYTTTFNEVITCDTLGATIVYTTDGSEPTLTNGTQVAAANAQSTPIATISISTTTTIRSAAFSGSFIPSNVDTQTYIYSAHVVTQPANPAGWPTGSVNGQNLDYEMDTPSNINSNSAEIQSALEEIPSISIVTDQDNLLDTSTGIYVNPGNRGELWERPASVEMIFPNGYTNPDGNTDGFGASCGLRIRGGFSRTKANAKHSFRLFFKAEYGDSSLDYKLFGNDGASSFKRIDFRTAQNYAWSLPSSNNGAKNTFIRDVFNRDTQRDLQGEYTRSRYFHLYLNGLYWGLYMTQERADSHHGDSYLGGKDEEYDTVKSAGSSGGYNTEASNGDLAGGAWETTWDLSKNVRDATATNNTAYFQLQGRDASGNIVPAQQNYLDVDSLIDYMMVVFYSGSADAPLAFGNASNNWFGMRNRVSNEHGFKFFMHDSEHSLDASNQVDVTGPYSPGKSDALNQSNPQFIHEYLSNNNEYKLKFADRAHAALHNDGALSYSKSLARIAKRETTIDTAIIAESARWGDERPEGPYTRANWLTAVSDIETWLNGREATIVSQLQNDGLFPNTMPPVFAAHGAVFNGTYSLQITNPGAQGSIYYTTDGSDPRAVGGAVLGTLYTSNITLTASTKVKARILNGGEWSALTEANFTKGSLPSSSNLVVSEFSYHSAPSTPGGLDGSEFDFIEIQNVSNLPVDLTSLRIDLGVTFDFSTVPQNQLTLNAGQTAIICEDVSSFEARYGTGLNLLGKWTGGLSNGGETLRFTHQGSSPTTVIEFAYNDKLPWPPHADGDGYSLVLINSASLPDHNDPNSWRCSTQINGSPGVADSIGPFTGNTGDDLNGNGILDIIEHLLTPVNGRFSTSSIVEVDDNGVITQHLAITFTRKIGVDDLDHVVETATSFSTWESGTDKVVIHSSDHNANGSKTETWRAVDPISTTAIRFLRLKVTKK